MHELWQLPGPHHFLRTIVGDLDDGRSCVLVRPRGAPPAGLQRQIRAELRGTRAWHSVTLSAEDGLPGKRYVDELFDRFDLPSPDETVRRTVGQLAAHPDWHYRSLLVDATMASGEELETWWRFVSEYGAASQPVSPQERTPILTVIDGRHADGLPAQNVLLTTRWWWSVVQRLDTEVHISALTLGRDIDPAVAAACTEIAGFDLQLAEELVLRWDGDVHSVPDLLDDYASSWPDELRGRRLQIEPPGNDKHPRNDHLTAWNDGLLGHWTGRPTWHLAGAERGDELVQHISKLVWRAQLATLLPEIEIYRLEIARWCDARRQHLRGRQFEDTDILELEYAKLLELMHALPHGRRDQQRQQVLRWMRDARNNLAHARTLRLSEIDRGRKLLRELATSAS